MKIHTGVEALQSQERLAIVGHIAWEGQPVPNVTKTTLVGGQWIPGYKFDKWLAGQKFKYDLVIVNNARNDDNGGATEAGADRYRLARGVQLPGKGSLTVGFTRATSWRLPGWREFPASGAAACCTAAPSCAGGWIWA
jgi:hypothetical protein